MDMERYARMRETVRELYRLCGIGAWDAVSAMLTEDFEIVEARSLPYPHRLYGKDALRIMYAEVFGYWADPVLETGDICVGDDNAIVLGVITATSRATGERLSMPLAEVIHLRGDQVCGITPYYFDTAEIARATAATAAS